MSLHPFRLAPMCQFLFSGLTTSIDRDNRVNRVTAAFGATCTGASEHQTAPLQDEEKVA